MSENYLQYYYLESYLSDAVRPRFAAQRSLSVEDFFCIIIWKANRAKSYVAQRLRDKAGGDLGAAVDALTRGLAQCADGKQRLRLLIQEWEFHLPMASAILSVLYPEEFTVYDTRVCDSLGGFHNLANRASFEKLWGGYQEFIQRVEEETPPALSLRDKDRYLWGKAFLKQLRDDAEAEFPKRSQAVGKTLRPPQT